jgi:hypothetical protein
MEEFLTEMKRRRIDPNYDDGKQRLAYSNFTDKFPLVSRNGCQTRQLGRRYGWGLEAPAPSITIVIINAKLVIIDVTALCSRRPHQ